MTIIDSNSNFIEVKGHSGYACYGSDIVCAAISTLVESTYNYLKLTNNNVDLEEKEAYFKIILISLNETGKAIINGFNSMIDELITQYSEFIGRK
jgi:uncharacterized protein YsxB (DUF464 family)